MQTGACGGPDRRRADGVFLGDAVPAGDDVPSDPDGRTHQKAEDHRRGGAEDALRPADRCDPALQYRRVLFRRDGVPRRLRPELPAGGWTFRSHPADVHIRQQAALPKVPSGAEERSLLRHHLFQLQLCGVAGGPPAVWGSGRDLHVHVPDPAPLHHVDGGAVPLHQRQQEGRLPQAGPPTPASSPFSRGCS